jgi:hypothetical protein
MKFTKTKYTSIIFHLHCFFYPIVMQCIMRKNRLITYAIYQLLLKLQIIKRNLLISKYGSFLFYIHNKDSIKYSHYFQY